MTYPTRTYYSEADKAPWDRAHRPKTCKLVENRTLARIVAKQLRKLWSPEQIAGWLKYTYPDNENDQVSHETIYRSLFIQPRGVLKKELLQHLRKTLKGEGLGQITDTVSIRERPAEVEDRAVPGYWEGDLVFGRNNSQIATLAERHTRFSLATDIKVYFCDPQHPWQRGSNENTNGLLRQYFPKGMDLPNVHQNRLNAVAKRLNERPREALQFYSPAEKFNECVALTG